MKYFYVWMLICLAACNDQPATHTDQPVTKPDTTQPPQQPPPPAEYDDNLVPLSISNSLDAVKLNQKMTIYVVVKNTGNDICNTCSVKLRYRLQGFDGATIMQGDLSAFPTPVDNVEPGQTVTIKTEFQPDRVGNYTFTLTELFGVFRGTNAEKHFQIPKLNAETSLKVLN